MISVYDYKFYIVISNKLLNYLYINFTYLLISRNLNNESDI